MRIRCIALATICALAVAVTTVSALQSRQDAGGETELPWAVKLGARAYQVECAFPVVSRVVLVPDGEAYLDEVSKWSPKGRWPVLFEDDLLAPMFIRKFEPAEVIRRERSRKESQEAQEGEERGWKPSRESLAQVVVRAWGGDPAQQTMAETFAAASYEPAGVVITSADDPAWTAAVALAAGRGQPLLWLNDDFGAPDDILDHDTAMRLISAVDALIDESGYPHDALGDTIDAITLCRSVGGSARMNPEVVATDSRLPEQYADGPRAVTDLIGRTNFKDRYAYTGWIFGDEARCAYMAMCSLFLDRDGAMLIHTYPDGEQWNRYHTNDAASLLAQRDYEVQQLAGEQTGSAAWRRLLAGGVDVDLVLMNTKGGADYFDLYDRRASPHDVPVLDAPAAVHLVHSWGLRYAERADSVGTAWLDRGAYALIGSVHEPYLGAFTPPVVVAQRLVNYVPLLVAGRWWDGEGPFADPWRVNTVGDPLMTCPPTFMNDSGDNAGLVLRDAQGNVVTRRRIESAADYGVNLVKSMPDRMRAAATDETGGVLSPVIADLILISRDDLGVQMWTMTKERGVADAALAAAAPRVVPALFRSRDVAAFVDAFERIEEPDRHSLTMLWHLLGPRIGTRIMTNDELRLLAEHPRRPLVHLDLERIATPAANRLGREYLRSRLEAERAAAIDQREKDGLDQLLAEWQD